jgi:tetratricopeptide (TPR) repeat protein
VVSIGFTEGFARSVVDGQITAMYRMDGGHVLRVSAPFPRGASGGGLFTDNGELIGILTFRGTAGEQLNYAVPTEWVERLLQEDSVALSPPDREPSFWEDTATHQPVFLQAAWLESMQAWPQLRALALDWTLSEDEDAEAWLALGRAELGLGNFREATLALRIAVARNERQVLAWYWLAAAYHRIGAPGDFVQAIDRVASLDRERASELAEWIDLHPH